MKEKIAYEMDANNFYHSFTVRNRTFNGIYFAIDWFNFYEKTFYD